MPFSRTFSQLGHKHYLFPTNLLFTLVLQGCHLWYLSEAVIPLWLQEVHGGQRIWDRRCRSQSDGDTGKGRVRVSVFQSGKIVRMCESGLESYKGSLDQHTVLAREDGFVRMFPVGLHLQFWLSSGYCGGASRDWLSWSLFLKTSAVLEKQTRRVSVEIMCEYLIFMYNCLLFSFIH